MPWASTAVLRGVRAVALGHDAGIRTRPGRRPACPARRAGARALLELDDQVQQVVVDEHALAEPVGLPAEALRAVVGGSCWLPMTRSMSCLWPSTLPRPVRLARSSEPSRSTASASSPTRARSMAETVSDAYCGRTIMSGAFHGP